MDLNNIAEKAKVEVLLKHGDEELVEFDIRLFFKYLYSRKFLFLIVLMTGIVVSIIASGIYIIATEYDGKVSAVYNLKFSGIDGGKNPHGGAYTYTEVVSTEVLTRAMDRTGIATNSPDITLEDIRQNINIQGIMPSDIMDRVLVINEIIQTEPSRIFDLVEMEYNPVQYILTLNVPKTWKVSKDEAVAFVDTIVLCYYDWFIENYGDYGVLAVLGDSVSFNNYDYTEQLQISQNRLSSIISYLTVKDSVRPDFISPSKGLRFEDILLNARILRDVDADIIDSLIYAYSLTKDKEKLLSVYQIRLLNYELALESSKQRVAVLESAISEYQRPQTTFIVPGVSGSDAGSTYESADYAEYDALTRQKIEANNEVIQAQYQIEQLQQRLERLQNEETVYGESKEKYMAVVEESLEKLAVDVEQIVELTNTVAEEYFKTYEFRDAVKTSVAAHFISAVSLATIIKIAAITVGGFAFIFIAFFSVKAFLYVMDAQESISKSTKYNSL